MPRRTRPKRRRSQPRQRPRETPVDVPGEAELLESYAHSLVRRGLASANILSRPTGPRP